MMECRSKILLLPLVLVVIALTASACMRTPSGSTPVYYYTLEYAPRPERFTRPLPCVLRVERFTATPPFNTQRIIYADKGLHRNAYAHFQWIAPPGELLAFALARDLRQTQGFQAVWTPDGASPATHIVTGWVEEFIEEDFSQPAQASLRISVALIDARQSDPTLRILFQKTYSAKAACDDRTPAALSVAMSAATAEISAEISEDIYRNLTPRN